MEKSWGTTMILASVVYSFIKDAQKRGEGGKNPIFFISQRNWKIIFVENNPIFQLTCCVEKMK